MLAPKELVATGPSTPSAAAVSRVVVVFPLVPETSAICRPVARCASRSGSMINPSRPPITEPSPRPVARDSAAAPLDTVVASLARNGLRVVTRTRVADPGPSTFLPAVPAPPVVSVPGSAVHGYLSQPLMGDRWPVRADRQFRPPPHATRFDLRFLFRMRSLVGWFTVDRGGKWSTVGRGGRAGRPCRPSGRAGGGSRVSRHPYPPAGREGAVDPPREVPGRVGGRCRDHQRAGTLSVRVPGA